MAGSASRTYSPLSTASTKINTIERPVRFRSGANDAGIATITSNLADFCLAQPHSFSSRTSPASDRSGHSTGFCSGSYSTAPSSHGIRTVQSKHETRHGISGQTIHKSERKSVYADYPASVSHYDATMPESLDSLSLKYIGYAGNRRHRTSRYASAASCDSDTLDDRGSSEGKSGTRSSVFSRRRGHLSGVSDVLDFSYQNYYPVACSSSATTSAPTSSGAKRRSPRRLGPVSLEPSCVTH